MKTLQKLVTGRDGQGMVEYMLIVFLVAFTLWVAVKDTTLGTILADNWSTVIDCVNAPFSSCASGS